MSVAASVVSLLPTSTIVDSRDLERTDDQTGIDPNSTVSVGNDETFKRQMCARFERRLQISKYLRDKRNEERLDYDTFIRINSKRLLCSYQIPAADIYSFLRRLYKVLAPGLRAENLRKTLGKHGISEEEERSLKVLHDWITCSDLTVQVFPKTPTVLWLDLECMVCKSGGTKGKHLKSKNIIETVVRVVSDFNKNNANTVGDCDVLYVTRGKTCGMHLFFPYVTVFNEDDLLELWAVVNRRLYETGQTAATVDTGCSAMPLPLSRNHNGLTRVHIKRGETDAKQMSVQAYQLTNPGIKDMARITNFYHLVAYVLKAKLPSPSSSVVSSVATTGRASIISNKRMHNNDTKTTTDGTDECLHAKKPKPDSSENVKDVTNESDRTEGHEIPIKEGETLSSNGDPLAKDLVIPKASANEKPDESGFNKLHEDKRMPPSKTTSSEECSNERSAEAEGEPAAFEIDTTIDNDVEEDCEERASKASSSSKRLVQTDIRSLCAKVNTRKRKRSLVDYTLNGNPVPKEPIIVPDDDDEVMNPDTYERDRNVSAGASKSLQAAKRRKPLSVTAADGSEPFSNDREDETASSFLCNGYAPSARSSRMCENSVLTTADEECEELASVFGRVERNHDAEKMIPGGGRLQEPEPRPPSSTTDTDSTWALQPPTTAFSNHNTTTDDTIPSDARMPELFDTSKRGNKDGDKPRKLTDPTDVASVKEAFENSMKLRLDNRQNPVHETDMQLITSIFNAEVDFYVSMLENSTPLGNNGLRIKPGCSLNHSRENCPSGLFQDYVPHVLYSEDFVNEKEWIAVLVRYFDEYLNNAPFLYVMLQVLRKDENVAKNLSESTRRQIERVTHNCLSRFKKETHERRDERYVPKQPYDEKCTVAIGLVAVCSLAFKVVTPIFTDLAKICRLLLGNSQQTSETLNTSTMPTTSNDGSYDSIQQDDLFFDESVSQVGYSKNNNNNNRNVVSNEDSFICGGVGTQKRHHQQEPSADKNSSTSIGNDHCIIASILRWNYSALADQTLWCLFFYYYHVHADCLARIMNEVVHGGLMVTAVLQAYFEIFANNAPVTVGLICRQVFNLNNAFQSSRDDEGNDEDQKLMPPPTKGRGKQKTTKKGKYGGSTSLESDERRQQFLDRNQNSKKAQRKVQEERNGRREDADEDAMWTSGGDGNGSKRSNYVYKTDFDEVLSLAVHRYLRPVSFDETTVVYTEAGYEQRHNECTSTFSTCNKELKATVKDTFSRATLRYSMPHGDLAMFNTDVMGTVHRRSSCTNNLVLNIFENMYGGCMTYLTRRYNNNLKLFNRFNGDAYRLVVECRHATNELIQSIEMSYVNLILRQPVVPPVLEHDIAVRHMFMSQEEIMRGAFVCLNAMDYMRCINMFTRHSKLPQENCRKAESFLDKVITNRNARCDGDEEARTCFRTSYLFFLLYIFEVLYKIRHAYNRDRTYYVSIERLSWDLDIRLLLKLFFGPREFKTPRGLSAEALKLLDIPANLYNECAAHEDFKTTEENKAAASRCINTRPTVSASLPDKEERMIELFKKKGIVIMKSYAPRCGEPATRTNNNTDVRRTDDPTDGSGGDNVRSTNPVSVFQEQERWSEPDNYGRGDEQECGLSYEERDRAFLDMTQAKLEDVLYSSATWYENCRVRMKAVARIKEAEKKTKELEMCMDAVSIDTFLRTQLRVNIDNHRLNYIDRAVRENRDFAFCTHMPLRTKMMALVLATHATKRMSTEVATEFVYKEYRLERSGVVRFAKKVRPSDGLHRRRNEDATETTRESSDNDTRPDLEWETLWNDLLRGRRSLLTYCRSLAETDFPESYFIGLHPDDSYNALYNYMLNKPQYTTLHALQDVPWAKDVCVAMNFLLVMNAYDTELVDLCLRLFLGFEWPGQWAKRIFVWKSNSNAGKSFFFESIISKVFDHSTSINDPKAGKDNAPEKSEYYKNFLLMINEFTTASSCELKKLCSTSGYKFRMNFGNQMIQAYMVGKMVFNCNTLPLTTDHATIQRVALIPLPFWFQKRQSVLDSLLNWTRGQTPCSDYEKNFRRKISKLLTANERLFFIDNNETKNENELFNEPDQNTLQMFNRVGGRKTGASMFLVQNKTSQVYMSSSPATGTIISGIMLITRYFCRFRYFNKIKEPVDFASIPTACTVASQEWERFSQPYYEWKERYRVEKDTSVRTKVSVIHNSLSHFAKNYSKNTSFFDLRQFFEVDFVENKIPYYNTNREDEYYIRLDPPQD